MKKKLTLMPEKKGESSGGSSKNNPGLGIDNFIQTKLLKHQEEALEWLLKRENSVESPAFWTRSEPLWGGILNDAATLGKKLSLLSLIAHDKKKSVEIKTTLVVVCAPSRVDDWLVQLRHVVEGKLKVLTDDDTNANFKDKVKGYDLVLITNHGLRHAMEDNTTLEENVWYRIILDGAHMIENIDDDTSQAVLKLKAERKWAVTGKPIQNGSYNLLPILSFLGFDSSAIWSQSLPELMKSISLARNKDVLGLPLKKVKVHYVDFSSEEQVIHDDLKHEAQSILRVRDSESQLQIYMLKLIRVCTDFALCHSDSDSDSDIEDISKNPELQKVLEARGDNSCAICVSPPKDTLVACCGHVFCRHCILPSLKNSGNSCPVCQRSISKSDLFSVEDYSPPNIGTSSKVSEVMKLIKESRDEFPAVKSVVFSQLPEVLRFLQEDLKSAGLKTLYLENNSDEEILEIVEQFQGEHGPVVMLAPIFVCCGRIGFGHVNLTAASRIYIMEPWPSPETEAQIIDLVHCIGQTKMVTIVKLIVSESIEEKILELQAYKRVMKREAFDGTGTYKKEDFQFIFEG